MLGMGVTRNMRLISEEKDNTGRGGEIMRRFTLGWVAMG